MIQSPGFRHRLGVRFERGIPRAHLFAAALLGLAFSSCDSSLEAVQLRVTHRMHPDFVEIERAVPGEKFQIGDTDFYGKIVDFVPDFAIDDRTKKVISRSKEMRNPALKVEVYEGSKRVEASWAFFTDVPHFAPKSELSFQVDSLIWVPGKAPATPSPDSLRSATEAGASGAVTPGAVTPGAGTPGVGTPGLGTPSTATPATATAGIGRTTP